MLVDCSSLLQTELEIRSRLLLIDVDVNLIWDGGPSSSSEDAKEIESDQNNNHKDYQHSNHSGVAAATAIIVSHKPDPPSKLVVQTDWGKVKM
jgi:hypothetical protein